MTQNTNLKSLKSALKDISSFEKKIADALPKQGFQADERYWTPTRDKAGNGYAVIRFLPAPVNESQPFALLWSHSFKWPATGQFYIENSLSTIGQPDPVSEHNQKLWATDIESNRKIVSNLTKRRLHYIANILVVKDSANRENEGKVFLYKFGKKIFNKIQSAMSPAFEDDVKINPFDPWEGANFKLKIKTVDEYPNYDESAFDAPSPLFGGSDEKIEALWKSEHSISEEIGASKFKTYDQLKKRLEQVLGLNSAPISAPSSAPVQQKAVTSTNTSTEEDASLLSSSATDDDDAFLAQLRQRIQEDSD